jgi:folylpolyglutamate synthase/dihydropteroate synthase
MGDKALAEMIAPLLTVARPLVCTGAPGARAATADELAAIARASGGRDIVLAGNLEGALAEAWARGPELVVAGSLYLAGAVLAHLGVPVD